MTNHRRLRRHNSRLSRRRLYGVPRRMKETTDGAPDEEHRDDIEGNDNQNKNDEHNSERRHFDTNQ